MLRKHYPGIFVGLMMGLSVPAILGPYSVQTLVEVWATFVLFALMWLLWEDVSREISQKRFGIRGTTVLLAQCFLIVLATWIFVRAPEPMVVFGVRITAIELLISAAVVFQLDKILDRRIAQSNQGRSALSGQAG